MPLSRYHIRFRDPVHAGSWLFYSTRKGSLVRLVDARADAVLAGEPTEAERATLSRLQLWVDDAEAERAEMLGIVDATNAKSRNFVATVVLTLDCNLACPYCFEGNFRDGSTMTEETARQLVAFVVREKIARGFDVEIRFYGGEPLMALPLLERIAGSLRDAATALGTKFRCSLVTNGTLLSRPVVERLLPYGLQSAQITLDGPAEIHDAQRPYAGGGGSYREIVANVAAVHDLITIKPGGNFTRENWRRFPEVLDDLLAAGVDPKKCDYVQFAPVMPKAGRTVGHDPGACMPSGAEPWLVEASLFLMDETLKRGFSILKPSMGACMVELSNWIVVNIDGGIYKCPVFMGWPELSVGNVADGISDFSASHRLDLWKTDECLDCAYLPLCFGGCRLISLQRDSTIGLDCRKPSYEAMLERVLLLGSGTR